jgi:hypothetical protein
VGVGEAGVGLVEARVGTNEPGVGVGEADAGVGDGGTTAAETSSNGAVVQAAATSPGGAGAGETALLLVYRGGSAKPDNLTPRPGIDTTGLSTFDNLEAATPPGGKAQVIDTRKLKPPLRATPDAPPPGHVSIGPLDPALINEWAATRGTGQVHPLTEAIMDAIVDVLRRPR